MALSLIESQAVAKMAEILYSFLPGSGASVTFQTVADNLGVGRFWPEGSKKPAIIALIEGVLEHDRSKFEPLILGIVRAGLQYRQRKKDPILRKEILELNNIILKLGFKFPELWAADFLDFLAVPLSSPLSPTEKADFHPDQEQAKSESIRKERLEHLKAEFYRLCSLSNRQQAGLDLEKLLGELFELHGLSPRGSFRVVGEQIDGSFILEGHTYLVEAKWLAYPVPEEPLLVFRGKIEGKSAWTRGLFIALNGFSDQAQRSITQGKQPNFLLMDGYDLTVVLEGIWRLDDLLRAKIRCLSEEGRVFVSVKDISQTGKSRIGNP